jgi:hypothetical protein
MIDGFSFNHFFLFFQLKIKWIEKHELEGERERALARVRICLASNFFAPPFE